MATRIKWSSLLQHADLEFTPEAPKVLEVSDELIQSVSWLTAATRENRRLIRCTEQGAILTGNAWDLLNEVETDELYPQSASPDSYTRTVPNKGVLVATSTQIVKITFVRVSGGSAEVIYLPPNWLYFFPHTVYSVAAAVVPDPGGTANYVGLTFYN